jgi:hypothetical protein
MSQPRQHLRLTLESIPIDRLALAERLDRDGTIQHLVVRGEHGRHPAMGDQGFDSVTAGDPGADNNHVDVSTRPPLISGVADQASKRLPQGVVAFLELG